MNIFVTGATGQLAQELKQLLPQATYLARKDCDLLSEQSITSYFSDKKIDLLINCGAYTQVDLAEEERESAFKVNALAPELLGKLAPRIIHFSTDYVFNGKSSIPYTEEAPTDPVNYYGETKLRGEEKLLKANPQAMVIRTSWVYSKVHGKNFFRTIKKLVQEKETLGIVFDQIGTPTNATDLSRFVVDHLLAGNPAGIFNYSNEGVCSWYDFACEIARAENAKCIIRPIESKDYVTKAKRPHFSLLNKKKIKVQFGVEIAHWNESFRN